MVFGDSTPTISQEGTTNVRPDPSQLHYTSAEGHTLSSSSTIYSDRIVEYDNFFRKNVSVIKK